MNGNKALRKSVLMDYVNKADRGKWNSLDMITACGWSGSAYLGGVLVDKFGYGFTFCITAFMQLFGTGFWLVLMLYVEPIEEKLRVEPLEEKLRHFVDESKPLLLSPPIFASGSAVKKETRKVNLDV